MENRNRLTRLRDRLDRFPSWLGGWLRDRLVGRVIPFVGTARLHIETLTPERVIIAMQGRRVSNHIGGPHAAATALLAETATGLAVGMSLPDDKVPLLKSMSLSYVKRSSLPQRAVAELAQDDRNRIVSDPEGEVDVPVEILSDGSDEPPVTCQMVWAWRTRGGDRP